MNRIQFWNKIEKLEKEKLEGLKKEDINTWLNTRAKYYKNQRKAEDAHFPELMSKQEHQQAIIDFINEHDLLEEFGISKIPDIETPVTIEHEPIEKSTDRTSLPQTELQPTQKLPEYQITHEDHLMFEKYGEDVVSPVITAQEFLARVLKKVFVNPETNELLQEKPKNLSTKIVNARNEVIAEIEHVLQTRNSLLEEGERPIEIASTNFGPLMNKRQVEIVILPSLSTEKAHQIRSDKANERSSQVGSTPNRFNKHEDFKGWGIGPEYFSITDVDLFRNELKFTGFLNFDGTVDSSKLKQYLLKFDSDLYRQLLKDKDRLIQDGRQTPETSNNITNYTKDISKILDTRKKQQVRPDTPITVRFKQEQKEKGPSLIDITEPQREIDPITGSETPIVDVTRQIIPDQISFSPDRTTKNIQKAKSESYEERLRKHMNRLAERRRIQREKQFGSGSTEGLPKFELKLPKGASYMAVIDEVMRQAMRTFLGRTPAGMALQSGLQLAEVAAKYVKENHPEVADKIKETLEKAPLSVLPKDIVEKIETGQELVQGYEKDLSEFVQGLSNNLFGSSNEEENQEKENQLELPLDKLARGGFITQRKGIQNAIQI